MCHLPALKSSTIFGHFRPWFNTLLFYWDHLKAETPELGEAMSTCSAGWSIYVPMGQPEHAMNMLWNSKEQSRSIFQLPTHHVGRPTCFCAHMRPMAEIKLCMFWIQKKRKKREPTMEVDHFSSWKLYGLVRLSTSFCTFTQGQIHSSWFLPWTINQHQAPLSINHY